MDTEKSSWKRLLPSEVSQVRGLARGVLSGLEDGTDPSVPGCPQPCAGGAHREVVSAPGGSALGSEGSAPDPERDDVCAKSELFSK